MKLEARKHIMRELIGYYGFDVMKGWADLHCVELHHDEDDAEWWLSNEDHEVILAVNDVCDGHGVWTGIKNETETWVSNNADEIHNIVWRIADDTGCNVWEYLEKHEHLSDECSWVLESILKRETVDYAFNRHIGWVVGNAITQLYQCVAADVVGEYK